MRVRVRVRVGVQRTWGRAGREAAERASRETVAVVSVSALRPPGLVGKSGNSRAAENDDMATGILT